MDKKLLLPALVAVFFILIWMVFEMPESQQAVPEDFRSVSGPCNFEFPRDHSLHEGYRTEWWYFTGNLHDSNDRPFGFQLTFFRSQILTIKEAEDLPIPASEWRTPQLYFAHAALSDINSNTFYQEDTMARGAVGLSGVSMKEEQVTIHVKDWTATISPDSHQLKCRTNDFSFNITLSPQKNIIAHGDEGYSQKGDSLDTASCYYSFSRLQADGTLQIDNQKYSVTGTAWMDHEYSSTLLDEKAIGWDWFSIQLENNTELMLFWIREGNGGFSNASGGSYIDSNGQTTHLTEADVQLQVLDKWISSTSKAAYPRRWNIRIPKLDMQLTVHSAMADQELDTSQSTGITYWEGSITASGSRQKEPVSGKGYAELTGYAAPFRSPL